MTSKPPGPDGGSTELGGEGTNVGGESPEPDPDAVGGEATIHDDTELERTIGLAGGLAIGIGTMIGAGIFVFPGLAAGNAGPAAALSFAIGGAIALLVALPASELATAMPRSGGGYFFISRSMGTAYGAVVGLGLWLGLVFASAFYLVGLGHYAAAVFAEVGLALPISPVVPLGLFFGVVLTAVSIGGTENTAKVQNAVVAVLLVILTAFLTYGSLDALGVFGRGTVPEAFFSQGTFPAFSTAALVFTSYLGFAQVATVAGDIQSPSRNLPLAMVGSVLVVTAFYVVTVFVATSAFGAERLSTFGETAMVEVAREFLGRPGAVAVLLAGLLATFSSANASILSGSRTVYALSRDALLPKRASEINLRYGTPHVALLAGGGPILVLVATGRVEVLAEVASLLHLVMYGLICTAVIVLRRRGPTWYDPSYRMPGVPALPAVGAVASFGLVAFMQPASIGVGVAVMAVSYLWYRYYAGSVELEGVV
ncbi:transport protein (probable substrate cationic amino acids) [Natronomonas moolapensis 8.8.11]|uniref:Transport protein (Probable substrate cationic amino acids) n=1 Tax=Natronomonas moolapensis (strain DSM 18674 / CECT 7526 / JCM 14361 / 8.8.11) TaxID=268739 RepID=M1Y1B8_NATM8|nr:APC family permease [Natronomonas moolapensis]CCQ36274.1 transport protein (probable substrate cationic amino acids) [Natronomonas moolapensis 8.8.11]